MLYFRQLCSVEFLAIWLFSSRCEIFGVGILTLAVIHKGRPRGGRLNRVKWTRRGKGKSIHFGR